MIDRRAMMLAAGVLPIGSRLLAAEPASDARVVRLAGEFVRAGVPGLTAGFARGNRIEASGVGLADVENETPATAETAYRYASTQKPMTAVAVLQLVEAGKISLDADIRRYVPYYPAKRWPITVRQLLGHQGGIPHYVGAAEQHITEHKNTRGAIAVFARHDLLFEPGTKFNYTSYGYDLLGAAIETVTDMPYAEYMRERVWRPAGMVATRMDDPSELIPHRARGYRRIGGALRNSEFVNISSRFAAGGARGTVIDMLRFQIALNEGKLLPPRRLEEMYTPMRTRSGGFSGFPRSLGYGMGWNVYRSNGRRLLHHDGGQPETRTMILNIPSENLAIATAQNLEEDVPGLPLAFRIYETLTGSPFEWSVSR